MGVKRAVDLAVENAAAHTGRIFTLGPLIHNNQTLEMLKSRGVNLFDPKNPPADPSTIIIRAHGIPPTEQNALATGPHTIVDGTCPKVKTVHKVISKYRELGYSIIITGDDGHAEVIGLMGYAGDSGRLIDSLEDIESIPPTDKICVVSQTTFSSNLFDEIGEALKARFPEADVVIKKTICAATYKRQEEIEELAPKVDAMIVVGGKNSANTVRLADLSRECGTPTQHIETEDEINWEAIRTCKTVGITAGASTPAWMIRRVQDYLLMLDKKNTGGPLGAITSAGRLLGDLNVIIAGGGVAMYCASCAVQHLAFSKTGALLTFLYLLSMYLWNGLAHIESDRHLDMARHRFYQSLRHPLTGLAGLCIVSLLGISFAHSHLLFLLMLIPTTAGFLYQLTIVPKPLQALIRYKNLKDIPTSRDLFVAIAWGLLITFIPQGMSGHFAITKTAAAVFGWTFFLSSIRSIIFDLRDIEGDRIMGRETLVTVIGEDRAKRVVNIALACAAVSLGIIATVFILPIAGVHDISAVGAVAVQLGVIACIKLMMQLQKKLAEGRALLFGLLGDLPFYLSGLGAGIAAAVLK